MELALQKEFLVGPATTTRTFGSIKKMKFLDYLCPEPHLSALKFRSILERLYMIISNRKKRRYESLKRIVYKFSDALLTKFK